MENSGCRDRTEPAGNVLLKGTNELLEYSRLLALWRCSLARNENRKLCGFFNEDLSGKNGSCSPDCFTVTYPIFRDPKYPL